LDPRGGSSPRGVAYPRGAFISHSANFSPNKLSEEVICALLRDFREHGQKAIAKVRRDQPGVYLKVLALLIPREHKVEQSNVIKNLSDQELEAMVEYLKTSLEAQARGSVTVIEGTAFFPIAFADQHSLANALSKSTESTAPS
jgi:hypothetical protein